MIKEMPGSVASGTRCICHTDLLSGQQFRPDPARKLSAHIPLLCVQWETFDDGQRNCPKHVEFHSKNKFEKLVHLVGPPLWSSGQSFWLQIQRPRVRSPALPDFLSSSGSGTGSTQPREPREPREVNWGATWMKKVAAPGLENRD